MVWYTSLYDLYEALDSGAYRPSGSRDDLTDVADLALKIYAWLENEPTKENALYAGYCMLTLLIRINDFKEKPIGLREAFVEKCNHILKDFYWLFSKEQHIEMQDILSNVLNSAKMDLEYIKKNRRGQSVSAVRRVVHRDDWHKDYFELIFPDVNSLLIDDTIYPREEGPNGPYYPETQLVSGDSGPNGPHHYKTQPAPGGSGPNGPNGPNDPNGPGPKMKTQAAPAGPIGPTGPTGPVPPEPEDRFEKDRSQKVDVHGLFAVAVLNSVVQSMTKAKDGRLRLVLKKNIPSIPGLDYCHGFTAVNDDIVMGHSCTTIYNNTPLSSYAAFYLSVLGAAPQINVDGDIFVDDRSIRLFNIVGDISRDDKLNQHFNSDGSYSIGMNLSEILSPQKLFYVATWLPQLARKAINRECNHVSQEQRARFPYTVFNASHFWDMNVRREEAYQRFYNRREIDR